MLEVIIRVKQQNKIILKKKTSRLYIEHNNRLEFEDKSYTRNFRISYRLINIYLAVSVTGFPENVLDDKHYELVAYSYLFIQTISNIAF